MRGPKKITLGDMRPSGINGSLIYCAETMCGQGIPPQKRELAKAETPVRPSSKPRQRSANLDRRRFLSPRKVLW